MGKVGCLKAKSNQRFESSAARNPLFSDEPSTSRATMAQGFIRRNRSAAAKRDRTLDSIGQMTRKALTAGKDRQTGRQGLRFY